MSELSDLYAYLNYTKNPNSQNRKTWTEVQNRKKREIEEKELERQRTEKQAEIEKKKEIEKQAYKKIKQIPHHIKALNERCERLYNKSNEMMLGAGTYDKEDDVFPYRDELTPEQNIALEVMLNCVKNGENVFLTGEAGTGKSFLIKKFIEILENDKKNIVITAPSGIAAVNIGGSTIHRAFQAPLTPFIDTEVTKSPDIIKKADIILIDEISMVRMDLFDFVSLTIQKAMKQSKRKKSLIVVGDFFQLPPVMSVEDRNILTRKYSMIKNGYAFEGKEWENCHFHNISLTNIIRQKDEELVNHLNMIRKGDFDAVSYFNSKSSNYPIDNGITVCGYNETAQGVNKDALKKLNTMSKKYYSNIRGSVEDKDKNTLDELELKVGARVMMLTNHPNGKWFNGSMGTITGLYKESIDVKIDHKSIVSVEKHKWNIEEYYVNNDGGLGKKIIGSFEQLPVKLAYAITIHKSQGQTFDAMNFIPECWAEGQLYVALSRIKDINKFHVEGQIQKKALKAASDVLLFYSTTIFENHSISDIEIATKM